MANFPFPFWKISVQKQLGAWSFGILVEDSDTGGPRSVDVRMECLFAYQFWYWELILDIENLWGGGRKHFLLIFFSGSTFNIGGWGLMRLVLYTSLKLQIPCTYSLPTPHIYRTSKRRPIWNSVEHLWWSYFTKIVNVLVVYFWKRAPSWIFDRIFDRILNANLPNNLLQLKEGLRRSFSPLELHKRILGSPYLLIHLIYTNNKENSSTT